MSLFLERRIPRILQRSSLITSRRYTELHRNLSFHSKWPQNTFLTILFGGEYICFFPSMEYLCLLISASFSGVAPHLGHGLQSIVTCLQSKQNSKVGINRIWVMLVSGNGKETPDNRLHILTFKAAFPFPHPINYVLSSPTQPFIHLIAIMFWVFKVMYSMRWAVANALRVAEALF